MFDSHCHLTDLEDPEQTLRDALDVGVSVLTCGYDAVSNEATTALAAKIPNLSYAIGLHPWHANEPVEPVLAMIRKRHPTAIGEIGLDLWGDEPIQPWARQLCVFETQLDLATELGLPVTIHCRKAIDPLLAILRNHSGIRGALHAFGGSPEQLASFLDLGLYVGLGGAVTRDRARRVRRCAKYAPSDRILLETDAPAIGMAGVEPLNVRPAHLAQIALAVAELRGLPLAEVQAITDQNARAVFGVEISTLPSVLQSPPLRR